MNIWVNTIIEVVTLEVMHKSVENGTQIVTVKWKGEFGDVILSIPRQFINRDFVWRHEFSELTISRCLDQIHDGFADSLVTFKDVDDKMKKNFAGHVMMVFCTPERAGRLRTLGK